MWRPLASGKKHHLELRATWGCAPRSPALFQGGTTKSRHLPARRESLWERPILCPSAAPEIRAWRSRPIRILHLTAPRPAGVANSPLRADSSIVLSNLIPWLAATTVGARAHHDGQLLMDGALDRRNLMDGDSSCRRPTSGIAQRRRPKQHQTKRATGSPNRRSRSTNRASSALTLNSSPNTTFVR